MADAHLHRRRFLGMAGGTVLGAAAAQPASAADTKPQVLILGAVMAGAAAAYWLRKAGISALVPEARDRIGGRLWMSTHWQDAPLDLGGT
jgi:monoamine oxidase